MRPPASWVRSGSEKAGVLVRPVRQARAVEADLLPRLAAVLGGPVVDLVAVAAQELEGRLGGQADAVDVRRALVAGVDDRVVDRVRGDHGLSAGELAGGIDIARETEPELGGQ